MTFGRPSALGPPRVPMNNVSAMSARARLTWLADG
jgi:hypothetical protein